MSGFDDSGKEKAFSLKKGIDGDQSRKNREEKTVQIRKDKRNDRATMQRRRVSSSRSQFRILNKIYIYLS